MTTDPYGSDEREARNNHGTCWVLQVAAFARLTGNHELVAYCRDRFKTVLVPNQMAADGSFPQELRRTKPYGYSLFNLEAMAAICQLLSTPEDKCFRAGRAAMVGDWPGYYSLYRDASISKVHDRLGLSPYPIGPAGKSLSYGGGHTFALTQRGANRPEALELLLYLTSFDQQLLEARNGCVPGRRSVMRKMQREADPANRARLAMLEKVIAEHILIPPTFARYPDVEGVLWRTVQRVMMDQLGVDEGLHLMREQIKEIVEGD